MVNIYFISRAFTNQNTGKPHMKTAWILLLNCQSLLPPSTATHTKTVRESAQSIQIWIGQQTTPECWALKIQLSQN